MFSNAWNVNQQTTPTATSRPNMSSARAAMRSPRHSTMPTRITSSADPMNPSSSPATVNTKSVCCSGTNKPLVCVPWNSPLPGQSAGADGDQRLVDVVAESLRVQLRVGERREPVHLVGADKKPDMTATVTPATPTAIRPAIHCVGDAGHREDAQHDGGHHGGRAEVRLQHDQRHRDGRHHEGESDVDVAAARARRPSARPATWPATTHQRDLGQLRRLQGEPGRSAIQAWAPLTARPEGAAPPPARRARPT